MTWSITARCPETGNVGIAVSTCLPAVGSLCPYVRSGVGAVATQSFVNPFLGSRGLALLEEGLRAPEVIGDLVEFDTERSLRQIAVVDREGVAAAFTGEDCHGFAGHMLGDGVAVAGNMLVGEETLSASLASFVDSAGEDLPERLLLALESGQAAGGDKRGRQSASLTVYADQEYPRVDLRVDEHADPVTELRRVFTVASDQLFPLLEMLPTAQDPAGTFDAESFRSEGSPGAP
ncbi:MAG: DUF1028 domain-containing protein [Brachybacterium sp.]|nr:DUF1028 domain-containing protein [Brachybacterium sp.]